jgi:formylmethanofuran dehydrogenase subunit B
LIFSKDAVAKPRVINDVVCLGCGCLCDDIRLTLSGERVPPAERACELGAQWFDSILVDRAPACQINSQNAALAAGYDRAAELLLSARLPLICGLAGAATDAQRIAVGIADRLGGCVDWTTSPADGASVVSFQTHGAVAASLGEIAQRADLVIFWHCDPATTHPRHFERYSLEPASPWLPGGRADRTVVAVGKADSATAQQADIVVPTNPESCIESLVLLRGLLSGKDFGEQAESLTGIDCEAWKNLAERIKSSRFTAIFYGASLKEQGSAAIGELTLLAQEAQQQTRLVTVSLGSASNAAGAENVLAWQTGYPMAVSFARGYPDYGPGEFTTESLLVSGEADAALVVAAEGLAGLSNSALQRLQEIPTVVLTSSDARDMAPDVTFGVAPLGAAPGGSVYRCDGITLPLENDLLAGSVSHAAVLTEIDMRLVKRPATTVARDR